MLKIELYLSTQSLTLMFPYYKNFVQLLYIVVATYNCLKFTNYIVLVSYYNFQHTSDSELLFKTVQKIILLIRQLTQVTNLTVHAL